MSREERKKLLAAETTFQEERSFPRILARTDVLLDRRDFLFFHQGGVMDEHSVHNVRFLTQPAFAGFPSPADDYAERRLDLNDLVVAHPISTYFMRVQGESMTSACIFDGDIVAVDRGLTATHNRIIVARLGDGFTLKRLQIIKGGKRSVFLTSEHPNYPAIEVTGRTDFEVWGVVTWVMHRLAGKRPQM
jgi:DNA polymerase V